MHNNSAIFHYTASAPVCAVIGTVEFEHSVHSFNLAFAWLKSHILEKKSQEINCIEGDEGLTRQKFTVHIYACMYESISKMEDSR